MRWSKLKSLVEARFATALAGRVAIFSTRYGNCTCGRAWITVDGAQVANFCTRAANPPVSVGSASAGPRGHGEFTRQDAYAACWAFVHDLSIEAATADPDPLVQTLVVLDRRLGRGRLQRVDWARLHVLAQDMLRVRLHAEGLPVPLGLAE